MLLPSPYLDIGARIDSTLDMVDKGYKVAQPGIFVTLFFDFRVPRSNCGILICTMVVLDPPTFGSDVVLLGQAIPNSLRAVENH